MGVGTAAGALGVDTPPVSSAAAPEAAAAFMVEPSAAVEPVVVESQKTFGGVSATAETVELGAAFAEFDKAEAERLAVVGEDQPTGVVEEDSLTEFFLAGKLDDVDDVFLDSDQGGKSKARDFEW
jgi:hypothetical protein